jgi:hypothetical protein
MVGFDDGKEPKRHAPESPDAGKTHSSIIDAVGIVCYK